MKMPNGVYELRHMALLMNRAEPVECTKHVPPVLYHVTTPKKAALYRAGGRIRQPVRGFDSLPAAMMWGLQTGRKVIYRISVDPEETHLLPDHHNEFGLAWWCSVDVPLDKLDCVVSANGAEDMEEP